MSEETTALRLRKLPQWIRDALEVYSAIHKTGGVENAVYEILATNREIRELKEWTGPQKAFKARMRNR